ncbi:MAG: tight adherence protein B [Acidimicrobiales bacterium]
MRRRVVLAIGLAVLLPLATVLGVMSAASARQDDNIQILDVDNGDHPTIELSVAIPAAFGSEPLTISDFALTEEGKPSPVAVSQERNAIDVVLAIDTSGSMRPNDALGRAKSAAAQLVAGLPADARIGVVGFGSATLIAGEITSDKAATLAAINSLQFSGDTALWDALVESVGVLGTSSRSNRYVVVLTDGTDDGSVSTKQEALDSLTSAEVALYAIGLETNETNFTELEASVDAVGGGFQTAADASTLDSVFGQIAERLTNRYRLTFEAAGTGEREIIVSVATESGLATVRQVTDVGGTPQATTTPTSVFTDFPPELRSSVAPRVLGLGQGWSLWLGAGTFFGAFALLAFVMLRPETSVRLASAGGAAKGAAEQTGGGISAIPDRLTSATDRALAGSERGSQLDRTLDSAGMEMRPGEFVVLVTVITAIMGLGLASLNGLLGLLAVIVVPLVAVMVVSRKLRKRREAFADQIGDTLNLLGGALRSGRGLPQALDLIAEESASPTREEFRRVIIESRVGRDVTDSLSDVADRMKNDDFQWVADAVGINRELGGDLAEILDNIGSVVRDRNQLRLQVKALAAEGRISGIVLVALPVGLFFYIQIANPNYGRELLRGGGLVALIVGVILIVLGWLWINKLSKLNY